MLNFAEAGLNRGIWQDESRSERMEEGIVGSADSEMINISKQDDLHVI